LTLEHDRVLDVVGALRMRAAAARNPTTDDCPTTVVADFTA